ncbi:hypothetical protein ABW19_dt0210215 [Dactylella cylindrospora]|nr:hypothetical protein ABW19_dt0210215 [Dactylella cylindrospora]
MASQAVGSPGDADQQRLRHLKLKIKAWEKEFTSKNNGKPPSRDDISANPKMASRYTEYQKLKKTASLRDSQINDSQQFSQSFSQLDSQTITKTPRKQPSQTTQTPFKTPSRPTTNVSANPFVATPTNRPEILGRFDSPSASAIRRLKWMTKGYVSPTPQKNGKVLGLFDKLPGMTPTPKRTRAEDDNALLAKLTESAKKSKINHSYESDEDDYVPLDPTTPSRKRRYEFQTPLSKKSHRNLSDEPDPFATPEFFRQHHYNFEVKENGSPATPEMARFAPPNRMIGKVKPLSALVKELREMQENFDPGMEVLREMEQQELNLQNSSKNADGTSNDGPHQATEDQLASRTGEDGDEGAGKAVKPPVYKKKGQKRQTKRVKIRPVRSAKAAVTAEESDDPGSESDAEMSDREGELNQPTTKGSIQVNSNEESDDAGESSAEEHDGEHNDNSEISEDELSAVEAKPGRKAASGRRGRSSNGTTQTTAKPAKSATAQKKKRMVGPEKHQNFHRMKIHHKGKKFKGKGRGRR